MLGNPNNTNIISKNKRKIVLLDSFCIGFKSMLKFDRYPFDARTPAYS